MWDNTNSTDKACCKLAECWHAFLGRLTRPIAMQTDGGGPYRPVLGQMSMRGEVFGLIPRTRFPGDTPCVRRWFIHRMRCAICFMQSFNYFKKCSDSFLETTWYVINIMQISLSKYYSYKKAFYTQKFGIRNFGPLYKI